MEFYFSNVSELAGWRFSNFVYKIDGGEISNGPTYGIKRQTPISADGNTIDFWFYFHFLLVE